VSIYNDIRHTIDTGDIILYSGNGPISNAIKVLTRSKWSHVGMAVRTDMDILLVYQSTTLTKVKDYNDNIGKKGVQINLLSESIEEYEGDIGVRHLVGERSGYMLDKLATFRSEMKDRPYEKSQRELIKSVYDGPGGRNIEDLDSLFCSELVAECYQQMGVLTEDKPSNEYVPADFSKDLDLSKNYVLSSIINL
jgi:hypothetical protein